MRVVALGLALLTASTVNGVNRCLDPDSPSYGCQSRNGYLDLNNCSIADGDVEDLASCFNNTGRGTIEALGLGSNDLTTLPAGFFNGLESLKWLRLRSNDLTTLPAGVFNGLESLMGLELSSNNLTTLPARLFNGVEGLGELNLSSNHLTTLPAGLFDGQWLELLDLSGNANLQCLPTGSPPTLDLSEYSMYDSPPFTILPGGFDGSRTCDCPEEACEGCESGKYGYTCPGINRINWRLDPDRESYRCKPGYWLIDLQNSGITDDDMEDLASCFDNAGRATIRLVYLSSYRLTLPEGIFDGLGALTDLFLGSSFLTALSAGLFDGLEALDTLILASDRLITLPAGIFDSLGALESLDLSRSANLQCLPGGAPEFTTLPDDFDGNGICGCPDEACDNCQPGKFGYTCDGITRTNPCLDSDSPDYRCQSGNEDVDLNRCRIVDGDVEHLASCFDNAGRGTLRKVNLQHNGFTTLPTGLFDGLEALTELNLEYNGVTTLPAGLFDGLEALAALNLGYNGLTTLPPGLFNGLRALRSLVLNNNELTTLPAGIFDGLGELDLLDIHKNGLTTLPAGALDDLGALRYLDMSWNSLMTIPAGLFDGLGALAYLDISQNSLTTLPAGLFDGLGALKRLSADNNQLTTLPPKGFEHLGALTELHLNDNNLTSVPPRYFDGLGALNRLFLSRNNLTTLPAKIFDGVGNLKDLRLAENNMTTLRAGIFDGVGKLSYLDLGATNLTNLPLGVFDGLQALGTLDLGRNNLTTLPARMFDHLGRLKQLILSENVNLQCLPSGSPSRTSLPKDFAGNGTCECPHEACEDCQPGKFGYACPGTNHINPCFAPDGAKYLCQSGNEKIDLLNCGITDNDLEGLASCFDSAGRGTIKQVMLGSLSMTTLPGGIFDGMEALKSLVLVDMKYMTTLPAGIFDDLGALHFLYLQETGLVTLPAGAFHGLGNVTMLRLESNGLVALPPGLFDGLGALETLSLNSNGLTTLPAGLFDGLRVLTTLSMDSNGLTTLPAGLFDGLRVLERLSLHDNDLTTLPTGVFDDLEALKYLSLHHNNLTTLPAGIFDELEALEELELNGNVNLQCLPSGSPSGATLPDYFDGSGACDCPAEACDGCEPGNLGYTCPAGVLLPDVKNVPELSAKAFSLCCESSDGDACPARCGRRPAVAPDHTSWYGYSAVLMAAGVATLTFLVACFFKSRKARGDGVTQRRLTCFGRFKRLVVVSKRPGLTV